jgi:hypothetical protein
MAHIEKSIGSIGLEICTVVVLHLNTPTKLWGMEFDLRATARFVENLML